MKEGVLSFSIETRISCETNCPNEVKNKVTSVEARGAVTLPQ